MWKTIVRRLLLLIPQLLILSVLIFILAYFMPGDALSGKIDERTSAARIEELRQMHGFYDKPHVKYFRWIGNALKGDLGDSLNYKIPVLQLIGQRAGNTFWLGLCTTIMMYMIAIPFGILSGRFHDKPLDRGITLYTYISFALPTVIFALLNLFFFCFKLKIFPFGNSVGVGLTPGTLSYFFSKLHHMILPAITGALLSTVGTIQYLRSEIMDYENSDFVVTAKSKGVPRRVIYSRHITRNAVIPVASSVGYSIAGLLTGSIFIETVFSYPGMGQLFIQSINSRDFAVVNTLIILYAILIVLGTLLSDVVLMMVDPRIRIE